MVDQVGFRFGLGGGLLFIATGAIVAVGVPPDVGVALLVVVAALVALALDVRHALALGVAGWAFATGFAVNSLGTLTLTSADLLRLAVFLVFVVLAAWVGRPR